MKKIMSKGSYRPTITYGNRIKRSSVRKGTKTILALDPPYSRSKTIEEIIKIVREYESYICAVKINFHMLLSYSPENIRTLNTFVHSYGIQSIADIKLNDIMNSMFLDYSIASKVDGIVVGATQIPILKIISRMTELPIYSPGVGVQGGDMKKAIANGTAYLIVGRSVFESKDPTKFLRSIKNISKISP